MPIYEFYCPDCHTIFNFLAKQVNTTKRPACPRCTRPDLERKFSRFAISKGRPEPSEGDDLPAGMDEAKLDRAMAELAQEAEGVSEDDPKQMARVMRKLFESTGMRMNSGMEEAMRRMEAGEDPDKIEEQMGDVLDEEEPLFDEGSSKLSRLRKRLLPPQEDETLYEL